MFYKSIEHTDYAFVHFENKIVLEIGELIKQILYYKTNRDIECFSPLFEYSTCFYNYCSTTELSTAKALNWLNSVCGFLLFLVPVRCARERNP